MKNQPSSLIEKEGSLLGRFAVRHALSIVFVSVALCLGGIYSALQVPSSVFPQTNFPRVAILIDSGVMPGDEMMARITRPIEEVMKDIPGAERVRSSTGRGAAEISVYFDWKTDMKQAELFVLGRLSQIRGSLPAEAETSVYRMTFSSFPILGVSLTSDTRDLVQLSETARYDLKPRFLGIPGVARVDLVGGRAAEYHITVDPVRLKSFGLTMQDIADALEQNNLITPAGMHEENHALYLTVLDGRIASPEALEDFVLQTPDGHPLRIADIGTVARGPEPVYNLVTADGQNAVLLNIRSQPDGSTLDIARELKRQLKELGTELPPDMKLAFFYDQSEIVKESVRSTWEALLLGIFLSTVVLYLFLKQVGTTFVAILVIPISVLITLLVLKLGGMSFNMMTLGGIAAAIGAIIDDSIVVVEAIATHISRGMKRLEAVKQTIGEISKPLLASTLTPVVVFIPLAFLDGITGVFFRSLAITMVVSLLTSLVLAVTLIPSVGAWIIRAKETDGEEAGGPVLRAIIRGYEKAVRGALGHRGLTVGFCLLLVAAGIALYPRLGSEFLPPMDEGGFVIDYVAPPGTSLKETNRELMKAEEILVSLPEVESYSRRTGARLALAVAEPHTGDFLVKLKNDRERATDEVMSELRRKFNTVAPLVEWEFPTVLGDLIGDLAWAPDPIEIRLFSTDVDFLKRKAPQVEEMIQAIPGIVDTFNGLVYTGNDISFRMREADARRYGLDTTAVAATLRAAMIGTTATAILEGDRVVDIRITADARKLATMAELRELPLRTPDGEIVKLSQVADLVIAPGQIELHRDNMKQSVSVTARLEGRDMGSAVHDIIAKLRQDPELPAGSFEIGGLYLQQQEAFRNLLAVLAMAIVLVFTVLLFEFRNFAAPVAIMLGALLALFGTVAALLLTGISLNIVSFLGAIIGIGIVAKNGILMLDMVDHLVEGGQPLTEALVHSGRRRLRPVLMTSLTTLLGMLPIAYGMGSGADMLRPLAVAVMGALTTSVLLSLIATPVFYHLLVSFKPRG
ncbi:efflux RND transporter permease subunit [Pontiella sulfatireligans]|uniref:Cobalt-zinc-cadmium resistance protein CzcA n=1 Tax=Pontiella sulfatireligans TaxID=2750658 RepID=A0A6C2UNS2_9BACT|nr:efflux RND transporter permease subunit [Pontiella sulfatireligans]VGO20987.1 Cobalt-zinc-cadmium resistance protein CzcA [Pontiella sulfatireligans]